MISVDDREPKNIFSFFSFYKIPHERVRLKKGDVVFQNLIIERKTVEDLAGSITGGRIVKQIENMKSYKYRFIIIVGNLDQIMAGIHPHAILGKIASLAIKHNLCVISVPNNQSFCYLVGRLVKQIKEEVKNEM